jgi:4-hydroxythreonine-4-phosphate dehydrogenase
MEPFSTNPADPNDTRPLAITFGDPAGIGPDIVILAATDLNGPPIPSFVVVGDPKVLAARAAMLGKEIRVALVTEDEIASGGSVDGAKVVERMIRVLPIELPEPVVPGRPDSGNGKTIIASIDSAVGLIAAKIARGVVTGPIAKGVLAVTGFPHKGHTDYLAELARKSWSWRGDPVMMLASHELRVVPLTVHVPIADVPRLITRERLTATARALQLALIGDFGIVRPRIAVAGLNPHAGEGGLIGREELDVIAPAVSELSTSMSITGPHPADTLFHEEARSTFDAVIAMYHDQALIPLKTLAFDRGVNITLGLPFVRTSPDHGTAFAIAGTGKASPTSFIEAVRAADRIANARVAADPGLRR